MEYYMKVTQKVEGGLEVGTVTQYTELVGKKLAEAKRATWCDKDGKEVVVKEKDGKVVGHVLTKECEDKIEQAKKEAEARQK